MGKLVQVSPGYSNVPLPDGGLYNQGQRISLTDDEYNNLIPLIRQQLMVLNNIPDPVSTNSIDTFTESYVRRILDQMGVPVFLTWDGSDYQPSRYKAGMNRPKTFIGPTDPNGFSGVVLANTDQWINISQ